MAASNRDIYIERGSTWGMTLTYKDSDGVPINLTGCSVKAEIKETADLEATTVLAISATITSALEGIIELALTKAQTDTLESVGPNFKYKKSYAYDVVLILSNGNQIRLLNGVANVSPGVTA